MTLLSVNVDHIATLRQARGVDYPDPVIAARIAEEAGAAGITVHLRADQRHIQLDDVERLRPQVRGKLNLEMSTTEEMMAAALDLRPDQITLVPERPEEITTEGGLDLLNHLESVAVLGVRCGLAAWGYNGERECERAAHLGHMVCTLDEVEHQLFD